MSEHKPDIFKSNTCPPCPIDASGFDKLIYWLGIGLGSGLPRRAPGTWGTVGGLVAAIPLLMLGFWWFLAVLIIGLLIGNYICGRTSELMNTPDDPHIVWDEWVGMWIALLPYAFLGLMLTPDQDGENFGAVFLIMGLFDNPLIGILILLLPFLLFRFFDVVKPFPISWADKKVSGGFGIMLDDILAGVMAAGVLIIMALILLTLF